MVTLKSLYPVIASRRRGNLFFGIASADFVSLAMTTNNRSFIFYVILDR
jgi:hypothetical protein